MELTIITPTSAQKISIAWLEINTPVGNFVIQPGHAPMVVTLSPKEKVMYGLENGKRESIMVNLGTAHITRTAVTLLLNVSAS